jgi:hypothetical protein
MSPVCLDLAVLGARPMQPGLSLTGLRLVRPLPFHRTGLPVLPQVSLRKHAITNAPANSPSARFALFLRDGSLPRVEAGSAFASHDFGTCSVFIPIMACSLADSFKGAFSIERFGRLVASSPAPTATGWSEFCRVGFLSTLPLESCAFLTAHFNSLLGGFDAKRCHAEGSVPLCLDKTF